MKLRNIRGLDRLECTVMPLMVSATETAEELSAAAVTRGIENPARKTSAVSLRMPAAGLLWACWQVSPCWCSHLWYNKR